MKKKFLILKSGFDPNTVAVPLGGVSSNKLLNNCAAWALKDAELNEDDDLVVIVLNTVPEQGGVAEQGGYNYIIIRANEIYATSVKPHPYLKTDADPNVVATMNADCIDFEACYNAYKNELYHTA